VDQSKTKFDNAVFSLSIVLSLPDIFATKVWRCPKSRKIIKVFFLTKV